MGKHDLQSIQKLLPNEDCSLCSAPSCHTLARRIVAGRIDAGSCPLVDKANLERIREILKEGVETSKQSVLDRPLIEIQPCAEYGRVTMEALLPRPKGSVYDLFDSCTMCTAFSDISDLDGVKCSLELGYGLAQLEEKRIHVFRSGKVTMRRAYDRRDAYKTLEMISRSLWPSVICSCGCTVQECVSCACPDCTDELCHGIEWGVRDIAYTEQALGQFLAHIFQSVDGGDADKDTIEAVKEYRKGLDIIVMLVGFLRKTDRLLRDGDMEKIESLRKSFHECQMDLAKLSIQLLVHAKGPNRLLGLILNGVESNLRNLGKGLFSIRDLKEHDLYEKAFEISMHGVKVFTELDIEGSRKMEEACRVFRERWTQHEYSMSSELILKVATYGCYCAKMLSRPIPIWTLEDEKAAQPKLSTEKDHCD